MRSLRSAVLLTLLASPILAPSAVAQAPPFHGVGTGTYVGSCVDTAAVVSLTVVWSPSPPVGDVVLVAWDACLANGHVMETYCDESGMPYRFSCWGHSNHFPENSTVRVDVDVRTGDFTIREYDWTRRQLLSVIEGTFLA